ncbi:hypothetical protein [uncultured Rhodoblastus sp.]|uniref:hypothetical protein n=1 Tax=uncultured Rhodoblastus sp. TaxID=543037 RepID=UPI0026003A12|nr:hypothetical protein [uncultured Rhodoblastus sp.]
MTDRSMIKLNFRYVCPHGAKALRRLHRADHDALVTRIVGITVGARQDYGENLRNTGMPRGQRGALLNP